MKGSVIGLLIILCIGSFIHMGCKQEASTTEETAADSTGVQAAPQATNTSASNPNTVANMPWTFLTHQLFHNRATVVSGKVGENPKAGHWIDFHDNGTYDYGVQGEKTQDGSYTYSDDTKVLQLTPRSGSPSEWRVMHKDDNLILVGTATYGNNTHQEQWVRRDYRPGQEPAQSED